MKRTKLRPDPFILLFVVIFCFSSSGHASSPAAPKYQVIYALRGGQDGAEPNSTLTFDQHGNVYGTTKIGGDLTCPNNSAGCGTVFQLKPPQKQGGAWVKSTLYTFKGNGDGWYPAGVVADKSGNLYGMVSDGILECQDYGECGSVFELKPPTKGGAWVKHVLYSFNKFDDGGDPLGSLTFDAAGNLYGTACIGGSAGYGSVFELAPSHDPNQTWNKTELFSFDWTDGHCPSAGVIFDNSGHNLFGITTGGGIQDQGLVFKLAPPVKQGDPWKESILLYFDGSNGRWPNDRLTFDTKGNLYGTTYTGGSGGCASGVVFQLKPPMWKENQLYVFCGLGAPDGVVIDSGTLYGATADGGTPERGTIFQLTPPTGNGKNWIESDLHTFEDGSGGSIPSASVRFGDDGALYGVTMNGGTNKCPAGCGVIFRMVP